MEVLSAFVRVHSDPLFQYKASLGDAAPPEPVEEQRRKATQYVDELDGPPVDVQAAVTVLGRLPRRAKANRGNLMRANLSGAIFVRADLTRTSFDEADLTRANFIEANLSEAFLVRANLSGAQLRDANLSGAILKDCESDWRRARRSELE